MADEKNVTFKQFKEFVEKADKRLDALEDGKAGKAEFVNITIPVSAWAENTDAATLAEGFALYADVAVAGLTANDGAETTLDVPSLAVAASCGMCGTADTGDGIVRYWAVSAPTKAMAAQVEIIQGKALAQ